MTRYAYLLGMIYVAAFVVEHKMAEIEAYQRIITIIIGDKPEIKFCDSDNDITRKKKM